MNEKYTATENAYKTIKDWIIKGYLLPGEKVDQDEIAHKLSLSRMPIRRALDRLSSDNLVIVTPHKGAIVSKLSVSEVYDIYDTRAQIEAMAIIRCILRVTNEDIKKLREMVRVQNEIYSITNDSIELSLNANRAFHRYIVMLAKSGCMLDIFDRLWDQSDRYRWIYHKQLRSSRSTKSPDHAEIVELIANGKAQEAADFMIRHTLKTQKALLTYLNAPIAPLEYKPYYLG